MSLPVTNNGLVLIQQDELQDLMRSLLQEQAETIVRTLSDRQSQIVKTDETKFLTRTEAAERLRITLPTLQKRLNEGTIAFKRMGRRVLIPEAALPKAE